MFKFLMSNEEWQATEIEKLKRKILDLNDGKEPRYEVRTSPMFHGRGLIYPYTLTGKELAEQVESLCHDLEKARTLERELMSDLVAYKSALNEAAHDLAVRIIEHGVDKMGEISSDDTHVIAARAADYINRVFGTAKEASDE
jgi:hypothetical protein